MPLAGRKPAARRMVRTRAQFLDLDAEFEADLKGRDGGRGMELLLELVARHSIWVGPRVARAVPVVFPKTARFVPGSGRMGRVEGGIRLWANQPAQAAIFAAMGSDKDEWSGQVVCHVYPMSPYDPHYFTRLANLFIVPQSLAAFTEWGPVLAAVKRRAFELYGFKGPRGREPTAGTGRLPWPPAASLAAKRERAVIANLRHLRKTRPMWSTPGGRLRPQPPPAAKRPTARHLDEEFWRACQAHEATMRAITGWVARHARFAPSATVAAVPNPFPKVRRVRFGRGERKGEVVHGIALADNGPCIVALLAALGYSTRATRGGLVDHLWEGAPYLPAHNAHLGGLVLVPRALGTFVDAAPLRLMLQRRAFERTGYRGPSGRTPPRSRWAPRDWPELVVQTPAQEARAVGRLRRYRRLRPSFFTGRHYRRRRAPW